MTDPCGPQQCFQAEAAFLGRDQTEAESLDSSLCRPAVSLLKDLKHANIVTLHDIIHTDKSLTLVFEYLVRTTRPRPP